MLPEYMPQFCRGCGESLSNVERQGRERRFCDRCEEVVWVQPKVSSAVIVEKQGKVLLVKRGFQPRKGSWALPAGYLERDEKAEKAAVRELEEETGLEADPQDLELLKNVDVVHPSGRHNLLAVYRIDISDVDGALEAGTDASQVSFRDPRAVQEEGLSLEKARREELI
jgi:8-oxo-dGTP diphosphatase